MDYLGLAAKYIPIVVLGLLPIMNPLSTVPLFLELTKRMSPERKHQQARRACLYALSILAVFLFIGNGIITLFGISLAGIRVAGGLIILVLAFRMLFSGEGEAASIEAEATEIKRAELDFSFSPLAMPSLAGPGSIAVVMSYGSQIPDDAQVFGHFIVICGISITVLIAYIALAGSAWIARFLGEHGIQAVTKIMGFLLTCIAVQFIASGVRDFSQTL
ncbi:stress protection protein MarC [Rhodospirillum rubrum]|uniref:MarC family NAAT transporter n=1 Tax=Rhodospirillum rubrum TaxID=1085 RepID=UPI0019083850|nr:MarC family NAAT transporter [Rhodospirillum rubrum]MBK1665593.1 stress protection protein MarC [Rhodospirillum rubrum]MBK1677705.1 stress protection protein MarC [Rhodospirillum rubrum]